MSCLESPEREDLDEREAGISLISTLVFRISVSQHVGATPGFGRVAPSFLYRLIDLSGVVDGENVSFRDCGQPLRIHPGNAACD